jgi:hypothetical protein
MTNPVAREATVNYAPSDGESYPAYRHVLTYCPGCKGAHAFTVEVFHRPDGSLHSSRQNGEAMPTWEWDGNLESPTFNPSLLAYSTVMTCKASHTVEPCEDHDNCEEQLHKITNYYDVEDSDEWMYGHDRTNHEGPCTWGNCHSFLHNGVWQFLSDCAHELAGQNVPMVPLPDYLMKRSF